MRTRGGFASGEFWMMRIVASGAGLESQFAHLRIPNASSAAMHTGFPVTQRGTVTTAAQFRALGDLYLPAIARLQRIQLGLIMTVETIIVPTMSAVAHHNVLVFLWDDDIAIGIVADGRGLIFLVTNVTLEI